MESMYLVRRMAFFYGSKLAQPLELGSVWCVADGIGVWISFSLLWAWKPVIGDWLQVKRDACKTKTETLSVERSTGKA